MMITHFFDTPYSSNCNVCTILCLMSLPLGNREVMYLWVPGKRFCWHNPSHSARPWQWRANSFEKSESLPQRCVCVGCQLNIDQSPRLLWLKRHARARGSSLWQHQLTRSEQNSMYSNICLLRESISKENAKKKTGNTLFDALLIWRFQNLAAADAAQKNLCFLKLFEVIHSLINKSINKLIQGQMFWEGVCFAEIDLMCSLWRS